MARFRVKLYELTHEYSWDDKGCGQLECVRLDEHSPRIKLKLHSEADESTCLLDSEVLEATDYRKQQDTLILWTEPDGRDVAVSFQEKAGCDEVWAKLRLFQNKPLVDPESDDVLESDVDQDDLEEDSDLLPECTLENLLDIAEILSNATLALKERLSTVIVTRDYVPQLIELFRSSEELDATEHLQQLCIVFKGLLSLNESAVCDTLFRPEYIMDLIGALEYDADYPGKVIRSTINVNRVYIGIFRTVFIYKGICLSCRLFALICFIMPDISHRAITGITGRTNPASGIS